MTGVVAPAAAPMAPATVGFLTHLAVALHKQRAYPAGHPMRLAALKAALQSLTGILRDQPTLRVGVARRQLMVDDTVTDPSHFVIRDFATRLHRIQIGAMTFRSGITLAEFAAVTERLVGDPPGRADRTATVPGYEAEHAEITPIAFDALGLRDGDDLGGESDLVWQELAQIVAGFESAGDVGSPAFVAMLLERLASAETRTAVAQAIERMGRLNLTLEGERRVQADLRLRDLLATLPPEALSLLLDIDVGRDGLKAIGAAVDWLPAAALIELVESAARTDRKSMSVVLLRLLQKMSRYGRGTGGVRPGADRDVRQIVKDLLHDWTLTDPNSRSHARLLETLARHEQATTAEGAPNEEWLRILQITIETGSSGDDVVDAVAQCVDAGLTAALVEMLESVDSDPAAAPIWRELLAAPQLRRIIQDESLGPDLIGRVLARTGPAEVPTLIDRVIALGAGPVRRIVAERLLSMGPLVFAQVVSQLDGGPADRCRLLDILGDLPALPPGIDIQSYLAATDPTVRVEAYRLALRDPKWYDDSLHSALADEDERVVEVALAAGAGRLPRQSLTRLLLLLSNSKRSVELRAQGVRILTQFDTPTVRDWLLANMITRPAWYRRRRLVPKTPITVAKLEVLAACWAGSAGADAVLRMALRSGDRDLIGACKGAFAS